MKFSTVVVLIALAGGGTYAYQKYGAAWTSAAPQTPPAPTMVSGTVPTSDVSIPSTITTLSGHTYTDCKLSRVTPDGISIMHSEGVAKIPFSDMDPTLAAQFHYDPAAAKNYADQQAEHDRESDAQRLATVQAAAAIAATQTVATPAAPATTPAAPTATSPTFATTSTTPPAAPKNGALNRAGIQQRIDNDNAKAQAQQPQ